MNIVERVTDYLTATEDKFSQGQDEYYARLALQQALEAYKEGNYGIGAVAVVVENDQIYEFLARNAMVTGLGVVDHAETRALLSVKGTDEPNAAYSHKLNTQTAKLPQGISMYGTLEPCPMCATTLTNVGARRSVSTVLDGRLIKADNGYHLSDGAANSIGEKAKLQPQVWQWIQNQQGLQFALLNTSDKNLVELSKQIFLQTREEIDQRLATRGILAYHSTREAGLRRYRRDAMPLDLISRRYIAADTIREHLPQNWTPDAGIILGSGLGALADEVTAVASIPYGEIPGFEQSSVVGHAGRLVLGELAGTRVAVMQGRFHYYEGHDLQQVTFPVQVIRELGAHTLVVTNAAGGLNPNFQAGDLMLIEDHINLLGWGGHNPLRGPNDMSLGPRFPAMNPAYDPELLQLAEKAAAECNVGVRRGVYIVVAGPNYETRAELRLLRQWGADAVGMSTVPEVLVARHGGMRVIGISNITNMALADSDEPVNHEEVLAVAEESRPRFVRLMKALVGRLGDEGRKTKDEG